MTALGRVRSAWHHAQARLWLSRIRVVPRDGLPRQGPALVVSLHRNGVVDGMVLMGLLPQPDFLVAANLRRNVLGRLLFGGIEVVRDRDHGDTSGNAAALDAAAGRLAAGGVIVAFPEGTSTLGPEPLPFKVGAARILERALARGNPVRVVPVGMFYERPAEFRSGLEVRLGPDVVTELPHGLDERARVDALHARITEALRALAARFASPEKQARAEALAHLATLRSERSYGAAVLQLSRGVRPRAAAAWSALQEVVARERPWLFEGLPLGSDAGWAPPLLTLALMAPFAAAAALVNLPPLLAGACAGRRLSDGLNVVALWSVLVGWPALVLWGGVVTVAGAVAGHVWLGAAWAALTLVGLLSWRRAKEAVVRMRNGLLARALRPRVVELQAAVEEELSRGEA